MARTSQHTEIERKFEVPEGWTLPDLAGTGRVASVAAPATMTQEATYLDTPDLALLRARHTLRRRTGGTDAGWHLKTPGEGAARGEFHAPLGRKATARIPGELRERIADIVGTDALTTVTVLTTQRTRHELRAQDGTVLALVEDDEVNAQVRLGGRGTQEWREVEVELVEGTDDDLAAVSQALIDSGLTPSESRSKLGRALGDVDAATAAPTTAGPAVLRYVADQVGVLQALEQAVRDDEPDAVHKARVATRRLRSTLRTFRPLFDTKTANGLRDEIKWLTEALGAPRDAEVMRDRLLGRLAEVEDDLVRGPVRKRLRRTLRKTHARAHASLVDALDSKRYDKLLTALVRFVEEPPYTDAADRKASTALPELVGAAADVVLEKAAVARDTTDHAEREEAIHDVRKRAKAARYAAEAAGGTVGAKATKIAGAWEDLQEALGVHQDSVVARGVLDSMYAAARKAGEDTFTYGVLVEQEAAIARDVESRYEELLEKARKQAKKLAD